jgi:hypothetical protein
MAATCTIVTPFQATDSSLKASEVKDAVRARRATFMTLRTLSNSFSKQRCSHARRVHFDLDVNRTYGLEAIEDDVRHLLWNTYMDKVSSADDVEETCYNFQDSYFVHPYVKQLEEVWEKCASASAKDTAIKPLLLGEEDLTNLVSGRGRGLEKKLLSEMKRNKEQVVKQVVDTHKSYKNVPLPADQKAKMLKNKYRKLSVQSKIFALTVAQADAQVAVKVYGNTVAATSA